MSPSMVIILSTNTTKHSTITCPEHRDSSIGFPVWSVHLPQETPVAFKTILAICHTIIFLTAVSGNFVTLVSVWKAGGATRITTRVLLSSLAISDIITAILITPVEMMFLLDDFKWSMGSFLCYTVSFMQTTAVAANAFTICVIAGDRYVGIARAPSMAARCLDGKMALVVTLAGAWSAAIAVSAPQLAMYEVVTFRNVLVSVDKVESRSYCMSTWVCRLENRQLYFTLLVAVVFLPLFLVVFGLYSHVAFVLWVKKPSESQSTSSTLRMKRRRKTAVTLVLLAVLFILCRAPNFIFIILMYAINIDSSMKTMILRDSLVLISLFNSALNPFLYAAHFLDGVTKHWKEGWRNVSKWWMKKSKKRSRGADGSGGDKHAEDGGLPPVNAPVVAIGEHQDMGNDMNTKGSKEGSETPRSRRDCDETAITNIPKALEVTIN